MAIPKHEARRLLLLRVAAADGIGVSSSEDLRCRRLRTNCAKSSRNNRSSADFATCVRWLQAAVAVLALFAADRALAGHTYYVAPNGSDHSSGSVDNPFGTLDHAIHVAVPGDTVYARGGTYTLDHRLLIDKAGSANSPINLWAVPGETPILDFSSNPRHASPPQPRTNDSVAATNDALGIYVANGGNWWHLKGLTIQNAPYYGVRVYGSHNIFEQLTLRYNKASGLEITGKDSLTPSYNLVLNCDSYLNFDPQTNGEDADGFAAKFDTLGPGNVLRGLRAWSNSDDGFDFWHATPGVLVEDCWSFDNGFKRSQWATQVKGSWRGDGLGFKLGASAGQLVLNRVVAWGNKAFGIDENGNGHPDGVIIRNATLVNNAKDGNPVQISLDDGMPHTVTNTIAFDLDGSGVTKFKGPVKGTFNTWNDIGVSAADFKSLDMDALFAAATAPRRDDGSLPEIGLRLAPSSHLIDAGMDVGLPYLGTAPDLGALEFSVEGDLTGDLCVDLLDLVVFVRYWLTSGSSAADLDGSGFVDLKDFAAFTWNWPPRCAVWTNVTAATVGMPRRHLHLHGGVSIP